MFKHAERGNTIELAVHLAVIAQVNFDRQTGTPAPRILGLPARTGHADPTHAVSLRGQSQQLAPAAADIKQPMTRLPPPLAAYTTNVGYLPHAQGCSSTN